MYGGPDHVGWPEEGEDIRIAAKPIAFEIACEDDANNVSGVFSDAASEALFDLCQLEIDAADCDYSDGRDYDDGPDYDHDDAPDYAHDRADD